LEQIGKYIVIVGREGQQRRRHRGGHHKGAKHVSLSIEDKDETTPIINWIRNQEVIVYPTYKGKTKKHKV
jgi:hypothetical protein